MNSKREALVRKVRAMLAKANGTTSAEEAMAFAEKAQAWMIRHDIAEAELAGPDAVRDYITKDAGVHKDSHYLDRVRLAMGRLFFCRYYVTHLANGNRMGHFTGEEHHVLMAQQMADYIEHRLFDLAMPGWDQREADKEMQDRYLFSFLDQASVTLAHRVMLRILATLKGEAKDETGTTLPALQNVWDKTQADIDAFLAQQFGAPLLPGTAVSVDVSDPDGVRDGHAAGEQIGLDLQVAATNKGLLK